MRTSNALPDSPIHPLIEALGHLSHAVERAWTYPDLARDGLPPVLDTAGSHLIQALKRHDHHEDAEVLARALSRCIVEGTLSCEPLKALLNTIDRLLICLSLENHPLKQRKRMSLNEAEPRILAYLKEHPNTNRATVAQAVGCSQGTIQKSRPWKAKVAARKAERGPGRRKTGLDIASDEQAMRSHRKAELDTLTEEQARDMRSNH